MDDAQRRRQFREARATGVVPKELIPWLLELADAAIPASVPARRRATPSERLAEQLGDELDRAMSERGVTQRDFGPARRSVQRLLAGGDAKLSTLAEIADALGLDAEVKLVPRGVTRDATGDTGDAPAIVGLKMESEAHE